MDIERLRALEKAVELVAKATPGPWGVDEYGDVQANGEDVARIATGDDHAAADAEIVAAAVNFIREHGSALIAELGQEVGAVAFEPTPMKEGRYGQEVAFRMGAYYYSFSATGVAIIDTILSAVACAGKAYHHTEFWNDESDPYHDRLRGNSPSDWIQHAADDAASVIRKMTSPAHTSEARDAETSDVIVCGLGDYGPVNREMVTILFDDMKIAECYRAEDAEYVASALRAYEADSLDSARLEWLWNDLRLMDRYNRFQEWDRVANNYREAIDVAMRQEAE